MNGQRKHRCVLALHLSARGLAFCVFDAPGSLHDWGLKRVETGNQRAGTLAIIGHLLQRFAPDSVVIEDVAALGARRSNKTRSLYNEIERLCDEQAIDVFSYPWEAVFRVFADCRPESRHDIAIAIARMLPMIKRRLPPKRHSWLPQDPRQALFDAAALGITHYTTHPAP